MVRPTVFTQSMGQICTPAERPEEASQDAFAWGPNLVVAAGDMIAQKTADKLMYLYAVGGAGGLGVAVAIAIYPFRTDAAGKVVIGADVALPAGYLYGLGGPTGPAWIAGTFDLADLKIAGVAVAGLSDVTTAFGATRVTQRPNGFVKIF